MPYKSSVEKTSYFPNVSECEVFIIKHLHIRLVS